VEKDVSSPDAENNKVTSQNEPPKEANSKQLEQQRQMTVDHSQTLSGQEQPKGAC
jgi:hypothetical protein